MNFQTLKKKFAKALKPPAKNPKSAFLEMGEWDKAEKRYASEGDFAVLVDPDGDAWVFMGPHESVARMVRQEQDG